MATPRTSFKTPKGTELPLLNLRGKEYLQVAHRLVWFREEHPQGAIRTTMKAAQGEGNNEYAVFQAEIYIMTDKGAMLVATAHKKETRGGFDDFMEKAETGAIGRALALLGYGTQFSADELNEGSRLADAPLETVTKTATVTPITTNGNGTETTTRRGSFRKNVTVPATTSTSNGAGDDI